ncbi:MAG TPA: hypothetical protein VFB59_05660 [Candidatus Saccharimonadales bacterium]|nr:hypothetical protein [Candidatus Saccharimonadales bacterium]
MNHEFAEKSPYNLAACVEQTQLSFPDRYGTFVGAGGYWRHDLALYAEQRYLPDQLDWNETYGMRLPQVTQALRTSLAEMPSPTIGHLLELQTTATTEMLAFGNHVLADAQAVAQTHPNVITTARLGDALQPEDARHVTDLLQRLRQNGHAILPASDTQPARLLMSPGEEWGSEDKISSNALAAAFTTVNLDLLNQAQPGIVGQRLAEWHMSHAQSEFARCSLIYFAHHELPFDALTPRFMLELADISDPQERQVELEQCRAILDRMATIVEYGDQVFQHFHRLLFSFYEIGGPLHKGTSGDPSGPYLNDKLRHVEACAGSGLTQAQQARTIEDLRHYFLAREPWSQMLPAADLQILANPYRYLSPANQNGKDQAITNQFLERHGLSFTDFEGLLSIGQQEGEDHFEPLGFDLLVNMFVMTRQGQANIFSPAQRALVEELYRSEQYQSRAGLANIRACWQVLDSLAK